MADQPDDKVATPDNPAPEPAPPKASFLSRFGAPLAGAGSGAVVFAALFASGIIFCPDAGKKDDGPPAAIVLSGPDSAIVGEMFTLDVDAGSTVTWASPKIENLSSLTGVETKTKDNRYISKLGATAKAPGTYYFGAMIAPRKGDIIQAWVPVVVTDGNEPSPGPSPGPAPTPKPPPGPEPIPVPPKPVPIPFTGPLHVIFVEDTSAATPERGRLFRDRDIAAYIKAKKIEFHVVDRNGKDAAGQTPADLKAYVERASGKTLPQLFLVTKDGDVLSEGQFPYSKTPAEFMTLIKKFTEPK